VSAVLPVQLCSGFSGSGGIEFGDSGCGRLRWLKYTTRKTPKLRCYKMFEKLTTFVVSKTELFHRVWWGDSTG